MSDNRGSSPGHYTPSLGHPTIMLGLGPYRVAMIKTATRLKQRANQRREEAVIRTATLGAQGSVCN